MDRKSSKLSRRQSMTLLAGSVLASGADGVAAKPLRSAQQASLTQIRNATLRLDYAGVRFLIDPMLGDKGAYSGIPRTPNSEMRNPLVSLPVPLETIVDVDAVIVTHLHRDHWDEAAISRLNKTITIFAHNEDDAARIREAKFVDVRVLTPTTSFRGVRLTRTEGEHGTDAVLDAFPQLGKVCGVVFSHKDFNTCYIAGDTIWNEHVRTAIAEHVPDVIVVNCGKAMFIDFDPIIMGEGDVLAVHKAAPGATIIASHMEAMNHCVLTRFDLRAFAEKEGFTNRLRIPSDGETLAV